MVTNFSLYQILAEQHVHFLLRTKEDTLQYINQYVMLHSYDFVINPFLPRYGDNGDKT